MSPISEPAIRNLLESALPCFLPFSSLVFLATGPHDFAAALFWTLPVWLCVGLDRWGPRIRPPTRSDRPSRPGTTLLYLLFALQWLNIGLMLTYAAALSFDSAPQIVTAAGNIAALRIMIGTTSCCSGIAVAHELIHRRAWHLRRMGRILLWTVLYEHFAIAHVRVHHRHAATAADPATARFGESFREFWSRSLKGQWRNAWQWENTRLTRLSPLRRWSRHRVLHGVLIQGLLLLAIAFQFGPIALAVFLYQAYAAVRLLETVNYFQHWGLCRTGIHFSATDAWATDAWLSQHLFLGLAHHADHHEHSGKPYTALAHRVESPLLPCGYFGLALLIKCNDARFHDLASRELRRRRLGPYAPQNSARAAPIAG